MKRSLRIGLTGGIGTGKSTALRRLSALGCRTISLDEIARRQARPGGSAYGKLVRSFGRGILGRGKAIDRARLGRLVFRNERALRRLERLTHPAILAEMRRRLRETSGVVVADVPLLFEKRLQGEFDATVMIAARPSSQSRRIMARDGLGKAEARRRMSAQRPVSEKAELADVVIWNEGGLKDFESRIDQYYRAFRLMRS
ncbi:MAG: dephospho-CoA kinase [Elusimicrobia bacterium]|nr:dephospho-CoA kinase [Elusimicrobiota bacterium]